MVVIALLLPGLVVLMLFGLDGLENFLFPGTRNGRELPQEMFRNGFELWQRALPTGQPHPTRQVIHVERRDRAAGCNATWEGGNLPRAPWRMDAPC